MRFLRSDPVAEMPDPDATPAADRDESATSPRRGIKEGLTRCEWCEWRDALTDVITVVRRLERDVAELRAAIERRTR